MPPGCDVDEDPGCEAGDAGVDMGEGGMALDMGGGGGADMGGGGVEPLFSELPPLDVVGATWTYRVTPVAGGAEFEETCRITEVSTWPDATIRSREECGAAVMEYSIQGDRITRRAVNGMALDQEALLFHVPLDVGDSWQTDFAVGGGPRTVESWTAVGMEPIPINGVDENALALEVDGTLAGQDFVVHVWWVSGVGRTRSEDAQVVRTLVSFAMP